MKKALWLVLLVALLSVGAGAQDLWSELDQEVEEAIAAGEMPGAVLLVGKGDEVLYSKVYGKRSAGMPLNREALFDAASLTKPLVTAVAVLMLAQEKQIDLDALVCEVLPTTWKTDATVRQLLTHHAGLPPGIPTEDFPQKLYELEPVHPPGEKFVYSDVGFLLLGKLVEKES